MEHILDVNGLKTYFPVKKGLFRRTQGYVKAVDDISFSIVAGETLGLVGESGCGKSTLGRSILQLIKPTAGEVFYKGKDISNLSFRSMRPIRRQMQMIFQDPYASLNARMTVRNILMEPFAIHGLYSQKERQERVAWLLEEVGLNKVLADRYPHEFSGGQRQRIGIARALTLEPEVIIADEPVSALDVSVQAQVLNLMQDLQEKYNLTYIFIAHDLSVIKHLCTRVGVMYLGRLVEMADKKNLYSSPRHPYTQALLSAVPVPDPEARREQIIISGDVPNPQNPPPGCAFHTRCNQAMKVCETVRPQLRHVATGHYTACHLYYSP